MRLCVKCPGCGEVFAPALSDAGKEVACPRCQRRTRTPAMPPERPRPASVAPDAAPAPAGRPRLGLGRWVWLWLVLAILLGGGGGLAVMWGLGALGKGRASPPGGAPAGKPSTAGREKATVMPVEEKSPVAGVTIPMKCAACGHAFSAPATDVTRHLTSGLANLYGGDIDKTLDNAQKSGGVGYPCPTCGKNAAMPSAAGGFVGGVGAPAASP